MATCKYYRELDVEPIAVTETKKPVGKLEYNVAKILAEEYEEEFIYVENKEEEYKTKLNFFKNVQL